MLGGMRIISFEGCWCIQHVSHLDSSTTFRLTTNDCCRCDLMHFLSLSICIHRSRHRLLAAPRSWRCVRRRLRDC
jgi:hypothetical protein